MEALFSEANLTAILLTLKLAAVVTLVLLLIGTPLAWWLSRTQSWLRGPVSALVAMPIVLPPSVIGFYMLLAMGPDGPIGVFTEALGIGTLPFTFGGLVVASVVYPECCTKICKRQRQQSPGIQWMLSCQTR